MGPWQNSTERHRHGAEDVGAAAIHTLPPGTEGGDDTLAAGDAPLELAGESSAASRDFDSASVPYRGGDSEEQPTVTKTAAVAEHQRFPSVDEDEDGQQDDNDGSGHESNEADDDDKPVTWSSLPNKGQLTILTFARLSEPLTQTSLQSYIFYQLKSFDPSLPDSMISWQAGILQGSFTAAQFVTAVFWGRLADMEQVGRKNVLLIGLMGSCISCLGFGFSKSFVSAVTFRTLGGVLNSNVGVMRTMIAEIIEEKK